MKGALKDDKNFPRIIRRPDSVNKHGQARENKRVAENGKTSQENPPEPLCRPHQERQRQVCQRRHDRERDVGEASAASHGGQLQTTDNLSCVSASLGHRQPWPGEGRQENEEKRESS